jgi:hypothetical protein
MERDGLYVQEELESVWKDMESPGDEIVIRVE